MWKDMEVYFRRDDDSAIGDSANNSAEEGSLNSRRKSETSDDACDLPMDSHNHLSSKLGLKIPGCLLKDVKNKQDDTSSIVCNGGDGKYNLKNKGRMSNGRSPEKRRYPNRFETKEDKLQLQLKHLLREMKGLRELDRDILRKFVTLNDCIEEVRWRLAENEAKFQRKLAEDDADEDFFSSLTDSRLGDWSEDPPQPSQSHQPSQSSRLIQPPAKEETIVSGSTKAVLNSEHFRPPLSSADPDPESPTTPRVKTQKTNPKPSTTAAPPSGDFNALSNRTNRSSFTNPTFSSVEKQPLKESQAKAEKLTDRTKGEELTFTRSTAPESSSSSDVWVAREKDKPTNVVTRRRSAKETRMSTQASKNCSKPTRSASFLAKKYNDLIQQNSNSPSSARSPAEVLPKVGRRAQWPFADKPQQQGGGSNKSDFQKQRDYQSLIGLSRVRGRAEMFKPGDGSRTATKSLDSSGSFNSTSSESTSSLTSPSRDMTNGGKAGKWNRLGPRSSLKSNRNGNNNSNNVSDMMILNNAFHAPVVPSPLPSRSPLLTRDKDVIAMSHQGASPGSICKWIRQQDDVTSLF